MLADDDFELHDQAAFIVPKAVAKALATRPPDDGSEISDSDDEEELHFSFQLVRHCV